MNEILVDQKASRCFSKLYVCMLIGYIYIYIHTYIHTYIYTHICTTSYAVCLCVSLEQNIMDFMGAACIVAPHTHTHTHTKECLTDLSGYISICM
jgi:hypothetical protein